MNNIKNKFTIIDFENKAHSIRIRERSYQLFNPSRQVIHEQSFAMEELRKMTPISLIQGKGWKTSKMAALSND